MSSLLKPLIKGAISSVKELNKLKGLEATPPTVVSRISGPRNAYKGTFSPEFIRKDGKYQELGDFGEKVADNLRTAQQARNIIRDQRFGQTGANRNTDTDEKVKEASEAMKALTNYISKTKKNSKIIKSGGSEDIPYTPEFKKGGLVRQGFPKLAKKGWK
jgi:hypothetical protein